MLKVYHQYSKIIDFKNLPSPEGVWTLQDVVGEGTYGEVYLAKNNDTGQEVAVKILESIHEVVEEIEEEYLVFRDLSHHPNIPDFFGLYLKTVDLGEDQLWMVMELCGGGSVTDLSRTLRKEGSKLEENIIAYILHETLVALKYLHNNNVMHRDVKGNNILLTTAGEVKLLDFGVSGHLEEKLGRRKTHVGTPYWMAPEVIACENQLEYNYDVRCDIWSLGVTAIELADGHPPLSDFDPRRALFKIPRNPPPTVKTTTEWSENFLDFIKRCLVKDFEKRPFTEDLLQHKFITQLSEEDIPSIKAKLLEYTSKMERTVNAPDVTTKHGQFKSGRKAQKDVKISSDLAKLENLDEETIVSQLLTRYIQDQVYTYIGDILLALNPFTPISIYTDEYSKMYMNASKDDNPPHIFAVADQSYQQMMHNKNNQCIVISGESGAGKTESANLLVQQLTQLGKAPNRTLEERILQVNPLMEAFGNAKTVINDNSSRFGKYLEMFFTPTGTVIGARITEYLLEKSRVIYQAKGEENFHIFYYIHDGLVSEDNSNSYFLGDSKHYRYINEHTNKPPDISSLSVNRVKFKAIQHCFNIIGFQSEEVNDVYSILAAILHIGNILFTEKELNGEDQCIIDDDKLIVIVSKLLGIDKGELKETLTTTGMVAKGEIIIRNNSVQEAVNTRDAMAKALYGRLFSWIVNRISSLLKPGKSQTDDNDGLVVGLLDIFGFENFEKNSFEQVCINIANEQIQYYFNQHIFAWEMQEYSNEGIDGSEINYVDNRDILDMFLIKPLGLLALLDEESHFPKATDQTLVEKFHHNIKSSVYSRPKADNLTFCIDHYAGRVEYDATGFLEKNRDRLSVEVVNILRTAENSVVKSLFLTPLSKTGNLQYGSISSSQSSSRSSTLPSPIGNGGIMVQSFNSRNTTSLGGSRIYSALHASGTASMTRIQQTVATYFRYSLMDLLAKMVTGSPHFVRCLKPNDEKDSGHFDSAKVLTQLRYTGVLETTKIRRQGYSHRVVFTDFIKRYHMLGFSWNENPSGNKESCKILLERLGLENWALGKTKVFLKYYHSEQLARMFEDRNHKIVSIQSSVRTFLARNRFYKLRWSREKAALQIQTCFRGHKERKKFLKESNRRSNAALDVQKVFRGYMVRKEIQPQIAHRRQASIAIQSAFRGHMVRKQAKKSKINEDDSARKIQRVFRCHRARVAAKQLRNEVQKKEHKAAKLIQTYFRMWRCKTIYQQLLDYKSKKEIELIYFGQQVEMYGKEICDELIANKDKSPNTTSLTDLLVTRPTVVDSVHSNNSVVSPVTKNDIGIQRMEQIERMNETKQIIPTAENSYYKQVNISKPEDKTNIAQDNSNLDIWTKEEKQVLTEEKQVATEEKQVATEEKQVATEGDTENVSRKHSSSQTTGQVINGKEIMDVENKEYYENIAEENLDRNFQKKGKEEPKSVSESQDSGKGSPALSRAFLAQSAAKSFIANKPKDLLEPLVLGKSESYSNLPWDAPLQNARQTALSVGSSNDDERAGGSHRLNAPVKPASRISINDDEDSMTERNGVVDEVDKYDLAHRLEEEVAGSIIALWQRNLPSGDYVLPEVNYDEDDEAFEDDNNLSVHSPAASRSPLQSISQKPYQSKPPPTLGLGGLKIEIIENSAKPNNNVKVNDNQTNIPIKIKSPDIKQSPQNTVPSPNKSMSPPSVKDSSTSNGLHVVEDDVLINLRSKLRKTKFNYESDASATKKPVEQPSNFVDFRSVLKKGRFSGQWE